MKYELGEDIYTKNGRKGVYAGYINDQHFIRFYMDQFDSMNEEYYSYLEDCLYPIDVILKKPSTEVYDKAIVLAQEQIETLNDIKNQLNTEINVLKKDLAEINKSMQDFPDMKTAMMFMQNKIKYFVIDNVRGIEIVEFATYMKSETDGNYSYDIKLLCLFGTKNRKIEWRTNRYYDGSGSWTTIVPFETYEDALAYIKTLYVAELEVFNTVANKAYNGSLSKFSKYFDLPKSYVEYTNQIKQEANEKRIEYLKNEIDKLKNC